MTEHGRPASPDMDREMFSNILVGVDRDGGGRDAIALAAKLGGVGAELTLAHIYLGDARFVPESGQDRALVERERARELLESACTQTGVDAHSRWSESSSVGRGLHELCEQIGADLLVVGSSRRTVLGRVLLGDDTHAALNGAPCALAIAPTGYADRSGEFRRIGVAYDGLPESVHAMSVGRELAAEHEAALSALKVVALPSYAFMGYPGPVDDAINALVDDARAEITALGGVEPHAAYGATAEELARYSSSLDLLIVGSRGYGPIGRLVHGGTSLQLARTAHCPLLVLTRTVATVAPTDDPESHRDRNRAANG